MNRCGSFELVSMIWNKVAVDTQKEEQVNNRSSTLLEEHFRKGK